ncbi:MAG: DNA polymerase I [Deltaproteobacteria bacterium]|nr:DNA polymerase I [Deltaproteobacteria bacterium]
MRARPTLYLVDISSLIFRAFFAIRKLTTSKGVPVNAVYGVTTMLLNLLEKRKSDYIACVFDTPAPSFRKEIYEGYKANRGAPPEELVPQFDLITRAVEALGIRRVMKPGFEADDLIATLARKFPECDVMIVSGDKDLMQLVGEHVRILDTMKDVVYGAAEVKEKLGVEPRFVADYLGLTGDSSDNIPGVDGIGPKGAAELIAEHGSIEDVLKAVPKMKPGKKRDSLEAGAELARLSKRLATVREDLLDETKDVKLEGLKRAEEFSEAFKSFLAEMEFKALQKKYFGESEAAAVAGKHETRKEPSRAERQTVRTAAEWEQCMDRLARSKRIACEIQMSGEATAGVVPEALYLAAEVEGAGGFSVLLGGAVAPRTALQALLDLVSGLGSGGHGAPCLVAYDVKRVFHAFLSCGIDARRIEGAVGAGKTFDLMLAHYLIEPDEKHELELLIGKYLPGELMPDPLRAALKLQDTLSEELRRLKLEKIFWEYEMPVALILAEMETNGIRVDPSVLQNLSREYSIELQKIEKEIHGHAGGPFNLNSPKQLAQILFEKLKLPVISKTKTGFSTDAEVLGKLAPLHPVPALIVRYRELAKLKHTYVDVLPGLIEKDGRVHARFNQAVAATGRLSGSDPNLQNIPIKTESGRKIRKAFVAEKGCRLVGADYSQIELRIVAHLAGDEALIRAFNEKQDVHRATAAEIFHVKPVEVTGRQRAAAKAINFGLIYGKTAFGLSQELGIPRGEALDYIERYFARYKGVKAFMDQCLADARKHHTATTFFGRRRPIRDIDSKNFAVRGNAERIAMNAPVQGTAADIMKLAMIRVARSCREMGAKLVLQVHDELVIEAPLSAVEDAKKALVSGMEGVVEFAVPLSVEVSAADNWMEL